MAESCTYTLFTNNTNLGKFSDVIRKNGSNDFSVVGASLKKPCTPNKIYTFGIMHKSFLYVLLIMKLDDAKLECGGVFVQMASKLDRSRSL